MPTKEARWKLFARTYETRRSLATAEEEVLIAVDAQGDDYVNAFPNMVDAHSTPQGALSLWGLPRNVERSLGEMKFATVRRPARC